MHIYDQILKRKKKENNDGHMERYHAVKNGYEIMYDFKQG